MDLSPIWTNWAPATCLPFDCFCEGDGGGLIRQPINTLSNLTFVFVGIWIWTRARNSFGRALAAIVVTIGLSSGFYHSSLSFVGQNFDVMAILLLPSLVVVDNIAHETKRPVLSLAWLYVLGNGVFLAIIAFIPELRRAMVGVLALALVLSEKRVQRVRDTKLLGAAVGCFSLAFLFWVPDRFQWVCSDSIPPLGHAIWHCLSAAAAAVLFLYLDSERDGIRQASP